MISRDRCITSYHLASLLRGRRRTCHRWSGKHRKTHWYEAISSALNFSFLKDISQNCFGFDVVKVNNDDVSRDGFLLDVVRFKN